MNTTSPIRAADVQRLVAARRGVAAEALRGPGRGRRLVEARQIAMYLARALTPLSDAALGARFGGRDASTVGHGARRVAARIAGDAAFAAEIAGMRAALPGPAGPIRPARPAPSGGTAAPAGDLPGVLEAVAALAGREAALVLALARGGAELHVSGSARRAARRLRAAGLDGAAAAALARHFRGEKLYIPRARRALAVHLAGQRVASREIAARLGITERTARRYAGAAGAAG